MVTGFEKHTKFQNKYNLVIMLWISEKFISFLAQKGLMWLVLGHA